MTIDEAEQQYRQNIKDTRRNTKFTKMVHDTRDGNSKVYGLTDDLIVSVDEKACKYWTWAIHDQDKKCNEICEMSHKWPGADAKRCKY